MSELHERWTTCALCEAGAPGKCAGRHGRLSLHHIHKHPRDDVEANLVMLGGDGTSGHHGLVEAADGRVLLALARYIRVMRPDTFGYLTTKLGGTIQASEWLTNLGRPKA